MRCSRSDTLRPKERTHRHRVARRHWLFQAETSRSVSRSRWRNPFRRLPSRRRVIHHWGGRCPWRYLARSPNRWWPRALSQLRIRGPGRQSSPTNTFATIDTASSRCGRHAGFETACPPSRDRLRSGLVSCLALKTTPPATYCLTATTRRAPVEARRVTALGPEVFVSNGKADRL